MVWAIVVIVVVVLVAGFLVTGFNKLRRGDVAAQEALGGIDVQLTRRADLVPNLVETVRGYAVHEREVLESVTQARTRVASAAAGASVAEKASADQQLQRSLVALDAVAEDYPDLKASANFGQLQKQLAETEDRISFARQHYNDAVARLNAMTRTIPWMFLTGMAGVRRREFYEAPEGNAEVPRVRF